VIDRRRVRELAERKTLRAGMVEFLEGIGGDVERMESLNAGSLLSAEELERLDKVAWEALDSLAGFARVIEIRMRSRGRINGETSEFLDKLERVSKAVYSFYISRLPAHSPELGTEKIGAMPRFKRVEDRVIRQTGRHFPYFAEFGRDDCSDPGTGNVMG
jgi:hypothetical protein